MRRRIATALGAVAVLAAGCGGGTRQDSAEKAESYDIDVVQARFPARQHLARQDRMVIEVKNSDSKTIPNLSVTIDPGFTARSERQDLSDPNRPVWIVDDGPLGGGTAYSNTWALGALKSGESKKFVWKVTAIRAGTHEVHYRVAAGLNGRAKAQVAGGGAAEGSFTVDVSSKPSQATVDPNTGKVVRSRSGASG